MPKKPKVKARVKKAAAKSAAEPAKINGQAQEFAHRFMTLKGDTTYQEIAKRLNKMGHRVSPQAVHKWSQSGGISPENLIGLAKVFGVQPAELYFGERQTMKPDQLSTEAELIGWAWDQVPERFRDPLRRDIITLAKSYIIAKPRTAVEEQFYLRLEHAAKSLPPPSA